MLRRCSWAAYRRNGRSRRRSAEAGRHLERHRLAVHIGSNPYRAAERNGPNFPPNGIEFTYSITEQQGNRFAGTSTNGKFTETLIGAISPDNRSGIILDDDGKYTFTVRDADTLDICYRHSFPTSRVVGCWPLTRSTR